MRGEADLATTGPGPARAITLGQLIALNDEMAALVHAGVPLDRGLLAVGRDLRGRVGPLAARLGERLERGDGLDAAIAAEGRSIPPFYRSVVEAGLRSGRLSRALEGLAVYARGFAETRRSIGLALLYPLLVVLLAYGLFVLYVLLVAPRFAAVFETFRIGSPWTLGLAGWLRPYLGYWLPIVPAGLVLLVAWWAISGRAATLRPGLLGGLLRLVPGLGPVLGLAQAADFADLLALMVEHDVPLDEGIELAAEATGAPALRASASAIAEGLRRGEPIDDLTRSGRSRGLPPMLAWVLATSGAGGALAPALRHAAGTYRLRSTRKAEVIQAALPSLVLCLVGAVAAMALIVAVLQPVASLWHGLSGPMPD